MSYNDDLIQEARKWVGVREATGHNDGPDVERFQKAVDGKAQGESWCMAFVQFCLMQVEAKNAMRTNLFHAEHCMTVWNNSPKSMRDTLPHPGFIVIWQHGTGSNGHTGIVTSESDSSGMFHTIEGNTGSGAGVIRDGDGVYERQRNLKGSGDMRVVGFLNPFAPNGTAPLIG